MKKKLKVLFNASVVLAGLNSSSGASGTLLSLVKKGEISGVISELIFEETMRHANKIGKQRGKMEMEVAGVFENENILPAPQEYTVKHYEGMVVDPGDAHVLATCEEEDCRVLVTLDKKHLLILQGKIKGIRILSPGQLLAEVKGK